MLYTLLKSKIHRVRVTQTELFYEGSITIDKTLMKKANIFPFEKVEVLNLNNGQRVQTYAIPGRKDSGVICLNGPAARAGYVGDELIILSYVNVEEKNLKHHKVKVVLVDEKNHFKGIKFFKI